MTTADSTATAAFSVSTASTASAADATISTSSSAVSAAVVPVACACACAVCACCESSFLSPRNIWITAGPLALSSINLALASGQRCVQSRMAAIVPIISRRRQT